MKKELIIEIGERGVIIGKTGSGKTTLMVKLILYSLAFPIVIIDTKVDDTFNILSYYYETNILQDVIERLEKEPVILYRPEPLDIIENKIDDFLNYLYENVRNCYVYIDEAYQLHTPTIDKGFLNLLMRGRSKNISVVCGVQRPRNVSRYIFTEANKFYIFELTDLEDRKRVYEFCAFEQVLEIPEQYHFWFSNLQKISYEEPISIEQIELDKFREDALKYKREKRFI